MKEAIKIENMTYQYKEKKIFDHFSLTVKNGSFITVVGSNGSGKSTLVKILLGLLRATGTISIFNTMLIPDQIKQIRSKIGVVFENSGQNFVAETVMDEIAFSLENMKLSKKEIRNRIDEVSNLLDLKPLLELEPSTLNCAEKQLVSFASALALHPKLILLDDSFLFIDEKKKEKQFELLRKLNREEGTTIINVTSNLEESLYGDEIIVIDEGKIILQGKKEEVLKQEKIFKDIGMDLPFLVDLSMKLQYYGLLNDLVFDMDKMVDILWK